MNETLDTGVSGRGPAPEQGLASARSSAPGSASSRAIAPDAQGLRADAAVGSFARPMRILMVLTYYHPHWTGLTAYAKRLAEGLARRGHAVTVLTSRHEASLPEEEFLEGVRVVRVPVLKRRISRGVLMPTFPAALWREMKRADVVQIHTPLLEAPLITFFGKLRHEPV